MATENSIVAGFTEEEKKAVGELKASLPEIIKDSGVPEDYTLWGISLNKESTDERLDVILIKFLRARSLDVNLAKEMLTKSLKWRIEFKADSLLSEEFPESTFAKVGFIHKHDKLNRPVTYNVYGGLDNQEVFGDLDRFLRWRIQLMEKGIRQLDFVKVDQMIQVHDYNSVSMMSYDKTAKAASKSVIEVTQDNYPEFLAVKLFVNVPWWGDMMFKFFSVFLSEQTKKKFVVASQGSVKSVMTPIIDEGCLPIAYGGESNVPGFEVQEVHI